MDAELVQALAAVNARFYEANAASFAQTRKAAWPGWRRVADCALDAWGESGRLGECRALRVLDVGCGTMRFERFLRERLAGMDVRYAGVDRCRALLPDDAQALAAFREVDVVGALAAGGHAELVRALGAGRADLTVAFALAHHVPGAELREQLVRALCAATAPGGVAAVSLWRFLDEPSLAARAQAAHEQATRELAAEGMLPADAAFEPGDRLIGWLGQAGAWRYCHSFDEREVDQLAQAGRRAGAGLAARFDADGRTGALNTYLVFRVP